MILVQANACVHNSKNIRGNFIFAHVDWTVIQHIMRIFLRGRIGKLPFFFHAFGCNMPTSQIGPVEHINCFRILNRMLLFINSDKGIDYNKIQSLRIYLGIVTIVGYAALI